MFLRRIATVVVVASTIAFGLLLPPAFAGVVPHSGTAYTWIGASADPPNQGDGHSWTDALNWSPNGVPGDGDSVTIEPPNPENCSAHVDHMPTVTLVNFQLSVAGQCSASIEGPGSVTVTGSFFWDSGAISTPVTLAGTSTGTIGQGQSPAPLKTLNADMTVDGSLTLDNVVDNGQVAQGDSFLVITDPNSLHITSTGTLTATQDNDISFSACCVTPAKVINDGQIDVTDGYLHIDAVEFDQNNDVTVANGAQLISTAAPDVLAAGVHFSGGGQMVYGDGAEPALNGAVHLAKPFHLALATNPGGGGGGPTLNGTGSLVGYGKMQWDAGVISAHLTIGHHVTVDAAGGAVNNTNSRRFLQSATVIDHGRITITRRATVNTSYGPNHLTVASDGVLSLAPGSKINSYSCCVDPDTVTNNGGQVVVPAASGGVKPGTPAKIVENAYVANGGMTSVAPGEVLYLDTGAQSSMTNTVVAGGGTLRNGAPVAVSGDINVQDASRLQLVNGGSFDGTATIDGDGPFSWTGGAFSGDVTVADTGGITISGHQYEKRINNIGGGSQPSHVTVNSDVTVQAGQPKHHNEIELGASTLTVTGSTTIRNHVDFYDGTLENTGTLTIDPGATGKVTFQYGAGRLVNRAEATLASGRLVGNDGYEQAAGTTTLDAGTKLVTQTSAPVTVSGGTLTGTGSVTGNLVNQGGTLDPGTAGAAGPPGTIRISGNYTQTSAGYLSLDFASAGHDRLAVHGTATLAGVLETTTAAGYSPPLGTNLQIITAGGGRSGKFDCVISTGGGQRWVPKYLSTQVRAVRSKAGASGCNVYHPQPMQPVTTKRVLAGTDTVVNMLGQGGVPTSGVTAVTLNVELTNATKAGALTVLPAGTGQVTTTTQTYDPTGPTTAQVTVALHNGEIRLHASKGAVTAKLDVVGYLTDAASTSNGARYHPMDPSTQSPVTVSSTQDKQVLIAGNGGVPASGATAVTLTVTVSNPSAASGLAVTPGNVAPGTARALLFNAGQSVSNLVTVPLSPTGRIRLHLDSGQATVTVTVLGYQTTDGTGSWLRLVQPQRFSDVILQQGYDANIIVHAATSVLVNASAFSPTADATLSTGPRDGTVAPIQQLVAGRSLSVATTVMPGTFTELTERLSAGQAEIDLDLLGYGVG